MDEEAVVLLVEEGYNHDTLFYLCTRLREEGYSPTIASHRNQLRSGRGDVIQASSPPAGPRLVIVLPASWDTRDTKYIDYIVEAYRGGALVAGVDSGVVLLARSGLLRGRRATGPPSVWNELMQCGAAIVGEPITVDERIVTVWGWDGLILLPRLVVAWLQGLWLGGLPIPLWG